MTTTGDQRIGRAMRRGASTILAIVVTASVLAGCSQEDQSQPDESTEPSGSEAGPESPSESGQGPSGSGQAVCMVGEWTSVGVEMQLDEMSGSGGAGVAMNIESTGDTELDFDGMERIDYTVGGAGESAGHWTYTGTASGTLALPPPGETSGTWEHAGDADYSGLGAHVVITSPFELDLGELSIAELAGSAGEVAGGISSEPVVDGLWSCTGDTLVSTAPDNLDVTWTFARTGPG